MIFLDTGFLYALFVSADRDHVRVRQVFEEYDGRDLTQTFLTTNLVISETITLVRKRPPKSHASAASVGQRLFDEYFARVHWVTADEQRAAWDYFLRHDDKEYSFVDCTSFVIMEKLGIHEAFAVDRDFTHNFTVRPGPAET